MFEKLLSCLAMKICEMAVAVCDFGIITVGSETSCYLPMLNLKIGFFSGVCSLFSVGSFGVSLGLSVSPLLGLFSASGFFSASVLAFPEGPFSASGCLLALVLASLEGLFSSSGFLSALVLESFEGTSFPPPCDSPEEVNMPIHVVQVRKRGCLWEDFYTQEDVKSCLSKVQTIGLNERKANGFGYVTATCSGYSIGSCNWIIETGSEKIVYLSASSSLSTHSKALSLVELYKPEALILSSLSHHPHRDPDAMLQQFNSSIISTLRSGGNVLIPCVPCGLTFDLLESLFSQINGYDLSQAPVFLVSDVARNCLAYANIYAEWLSEGKIARAFIPDDPFLHGTLVKTNRLRPCRSVYGSISREIKSPCVVFASHPSLRIGDVVHFMTVWKDDPANTIVITDPDYATNDILLPFLPMKMKAVFCPIDTRLTVDQISQITAVVQPKAIYMHISDQKFLSTQLNIPEYTFAKHVTCYSKDKVLEIPCQKRWLKLAIDPKVAADCVLQDLGNGNAVAQLVGMMSLTRGSFLSLEEDPTLSSTSLTQLACADTDPIFKRIEKLGFEQSNKHKNTKEKIYEKDTTSVTFSSNGVHVVMKQYDERLRQCLKNTIMEALVKL
ncbi:hypothetical protein M513_03262 [Trichuris suis]|uniref:Beta-Casp domain-containing protein n=1 Tax=Trichuris suis TaxID=68888 RepID=A0A085MF27_9BILA|nr:hypothetical protein M513_03262 [Trichuris suis]